MKLVAKNNGVRIVEKDLLPVFESVSPHVYDWKLVTFIWTTLKERWVFLLCFCIICLFKQQVGNFVM